MTRSRDAALAERIMLGLDCYEKANIKLKGLTDGGRRSVFVQQLVESVRRTEFPRVLKQRKLSARFADPNDELFDPLRAAIFFQRNGSIEEAFWLVFLFVHFGKTKKGGYRYAREVYGRLGDGKQWDWQSVSADPKGFRAWLRDHQTELERKDPPGGFGNHRKYESLNATSSRGTGAAVESYVAWVRAGGSHVRLIANAAKNADGDRRKAFDILYRSMSVASFGRLARFDYFAMLGKLDLAPIDPGSAYIVGSTGPVAGGRLLITDNQNGRSSGKAIDALLLELDQFLQVGMQPLEDAVCNWQKSPDVFTAYRG